MVATPPERRGEETEMGEFKEIFKKMLKVMEWMVDRIENLVEGQEELIEQQRLTGLGVEKMLRVIKGKDWKQEEERVMEWEKVKEMEKVVEGEEEEKMDSEDETEETMVGEKDGDGENLARADK